LPGFGATFSPAGHQPAAADAPKLDWDRLVDGVFIEEIAKMVTAVPGWQPPRGD
jgi:hypothetical protein